MFMQETDVTGVQAALDAIFQHVPAEERHLVLVSMLKDLTSAWVTVPGGDSSLVRILEHLRHLYGLERSYDANLDTFGAFQNEMRELHYRFCNLLLSIYPLGNERFGGPVLMDFRKEILRSIAAEWNGKLDERGSELFNLLWSALVPRHGGNVADKEEQEMIFGVLRERLKAPVFTESVLRCILLHLNKTSGSLSTSEENVAQVEIWKDVFMLFAIARTRNGGWSEVLDDIRLRESAGM